ncbi:helix-turn-helix domain-containing protein [Corynebacterium uberis]|uniref:helix-turn-helix domain-containing protein n=1 Tax=Corynebacterium TaxID=1716 RepID=UPI001D0A3E47|nr:helix-turn-helix transcriptional regulator [Corynebacterium uberis]UDL76906.1 helix-turn-helix transcriptional regulator [Corynebacterium uberis]UDL79117.1 helix-turn-helix transcriptional regulator [Corynebacterium uberis]UDL81321.1 helix-turn-helix transcriptional regulator [Corynebacterium uberis]UDL83534.1 helix-turn-helix transcriptional regulator [Corynebacterium uberis]
MTTSKPSRRLSPEECVAIKVNQLLLVHGRTKKDLAEALNMSAVNLGRKVRGKVNWSLSELYTTADFFGVDITDLLPRRIATAGMQETPGTLSRSEGSNLVAGAGFEPTTSGL